MPPLSIGHGDAPVTVLGRRIKVARGPFAVARLTAAPVVMVFSLWHRHEPIIEIRALEPRWPEKS